MKKNYWLMAALLFLASACESHKKTESVPVLAVAQHEAHMTETSHEVDLLKLFSPYIKGVWVKADYIAEVRKTKSPLAAFAKVGEISTVLIDPSKAVGDSLEVGFSLGNHEGGSFQLLFRPGSRQKFLQTNYPDYEHTGQAKELGFQVVGKDTFLLIETLNKNKELLRSDKYVKAFTSQSEEDDASSGLDYLVRKNLIAGTYGYRDIKGKSMKVDFTSSGGVKGFPGFKSYTVITDFAVAIENNLDVLIFNYDEENQKSFAYTIKADTLHLFDYYLGKDSLHLVEGALKYKLIRIAK
ncbi:hypothetical protein GU926_17195 [Nibribacter ruber]|uniref:Uncharacterized protein n=1 Tax=Nibribacter ruber TaxID=2698458 RepID=A0A6P1P3Q9_9BACT|nr:hypothetical protein [Nibribacter ruber]QHL89069.1 hypothetical protein GU926_17195 [Nibribacter ruber]